MKEMFRLPNVQDIVNPAAVDKVLFDFTKSSTRTPEENTKLKSQWRMSDDSVLGGGSRGETTITDKNFLRWNGNTDTRVRDKTVKRSGFCSILSPEFKLDLSKCNALSLTLRSNHSRNFMVNLHVDNFLPGEMYQGYLVGKTGEVGKWVTVTLPFKKFLLTSMGQVKNAQDSSLSEYEYIERVGFTIADKEDGPFELDIEKIEGVSVARDVVEDNMEMDKTSRSERERREL